MLEINLLGQFDVQLNNEPADLNSRPAQLLLSYLVLNAGQTIRRERLAGLFWPDSPESTARKNLRHVLWSLRKAIGQEYLVTDKSTVTFNDEASYQLDVDILNGDSGDEIEVLIESVSAYKGDLLPGFYDDWILLERDRLQTLFERRMQLLLDQLEENARWPELANWSEHWLAFGQIPEPAYRSLMTGYAGLGDLAGVTTSYRRCVQALDEELGVEPSAETQSLFERLSQGERPVTPSSPIPMTGSLPPCPYRGLSAFREEDAPYFFGREVFTRQLVEIVQKRALVAVVGPSGSGKSSVVFAGLLGQLRQQVNFIIATLRPGSDPFASLAATLLPHLEPDISESDRLVETRELAQSLSTGDITLADVVARILEKDGKSSRLLLVADQFEELYTLCPEPEVRHKFLDILLDLIKRQLFRREPTFTLVFTLRADFLEQALTYRPLADAIQDATLMLGPMIRGELRRAIEKPAEKLDVTFETGLVERILDDVGEEPGNLPLLEFALTTLWEQQQAGTLSHSGYEANDRVEGALTRHAEQTFTALKPEEQEAARRILIQLVNPGNGTEDTRRIAHKDEFDEYGWNIINRLADARLVITGRNAVGEETVEIIHEALIQNWKRLREWMAADRTFRLWQERLRGALNQWQATNQDEGALLRGLPLAEAEGWLAERAENLSQAEREYIQASLAVRKRRKAESEQERLARERLRQRITVGAIAGLIIALALAILAGSQWQQAAQERQVALEAQAAAAAERDQAQLALSRQLAALAQITLEDQLDLALLLSLEASRIANTREARSMLRAGLVSNPRLITYLRGHTDRVSSVIFSPDGQTLASASNDDTIILWDVASGRSLGPPLLGHTDNLLSLAFSPDGRTLASGSNDKSIILWDMASGEPLGSPLNGHASSVSSVIFSPDGQTLASTGDENIILWDISSNPNKLATNKPPQNDTLIGHKDMVRSLVFSPDGQTLASGGNDKTIILWDVSSGEPLGSPLIDHDDLIRSLAFSPDGQILAAAGESGKIFLWNMNSSPSLTKSLEGHTSSVRSVAFNPKPSGDSGDHLLVSGSTDGTIILWDAASGQPLDPPLTGHADWVRSVAFSPDGQTLASASHDHTIALWDATSQKLDAFALGPPLNGHSESVRTVAISPDGQTLASGSDDESIILWDMATGEPIGPPLSGHTESVQSVAFSLDGQTLASGSNDETVILWDVASGESLGPPLTGHMESVQSVSISPDGQTLASGSKDKNIILWNVASGEPLGPPLTGHKESVQSVAFSPDGQTLASSSADKTVILWDMTTNSPHHSATLNGHKDVVFSSVFSPDSQTLASGSWDKTIILWDVDSGEPLGPPLTGHTESVQNVAFSPDGQTLASGSWDESIILWDASSGEPIGPSLTGHTGSVRGLTFSRDGQTLASASDDGTIILWDMSLESWQTRACQRANRNLSKVEWQQFFGDQPYRATCPDSPIPEE